MEQGVSGVRWVEPAKLCVSQLYVSRAKLQAIQAWLTPATLQACRPLPVHDFGDGALTLTDGHTRALAFLLLGQRCPVCYDTDQTVTSREGQAAYRTAIGWCRNAGVYTVEDLRERTLEESQYQRLWVERCERAFAGL